MIPDPLDWLPQELAALDEQGLRRRLGTRHPAGGPIIDRGRAGALVNFASNDYLGLASHPRLREAASQAAATTVGAGASPVVSGRTSLHAKLENELANLLGVEAALVFSSGFATGVGVIPALVGTGDAILSDQLNHACLIDGCRLSSAERIIYRHGDANHLAELLAGTSGCRRRLIVTDSLFSMGGDFAPLAELGRLAEEHNAMLLVDEAHATGVWGPRGGGAVDMLVGDHPDLPRQVSIRMGTLSKALGTAGGFVAGSRLLIDWITNRARSYVFSTALPVPVIAAGLAALEIVRHAGAEREAFQQVVRGVRRELVRQGWQTGQSESQIIPVVVGQPEPTMQLAARLLERGLWVPGIRPPTVPDGQSQLRISLRADHQPEHIEQLLNALAEQRSRL